MNTAIISDGANLIAFEHMDGAFLGSVEIAQQKARTSANFPFPTRRFAEVAFGKEGKPGIANVPGVAAIPGGMPIITASKAQIGSSGVSGGTADQDELCAQAGLAAVLDDLK